MKGLPSGYNKDLQEDKHAVFDAEDTLAGCLAVVRSVVDGLTLNREPGRGGGIRLAARHRRCGLPGRPRRAVPPRARDRRRARAKAGRGRPRIRVADAWRNGARPASLFDADVVARVTPRASVAAKRTPQSTAPAAVQDALSRGRSSGWKIALAGRLLPP